MSLQVEAEEFFERMGEDAELRRQISSDPKGSLKKAGIDIPQGVDIQVHENSADTFHAVLPLKEEGILEMWEHISPPGAKVIERAWSDAEYKKRLFSDPRGAFIEVTDITPPENLKIFVHENSDTKQHFILPAVVSESEELSDADLEAVAGGKGMGKSCKKGVRTMTDDVLPKIIGPAKAPAFIATGVLGIFSAIFKV
jgi:hypothetical protein